MADSCGRELQLFYFTSGTYSESALAYAERFGMALFTYDRAGVVSHANAVALTALLATPDGATSPNGPDPARLGAPTGSESLPPVSHTGDLHSWATAAWQAREAPPPARELLAYLPLAVSLLVGLVTLLVARAWQTGAEPTTHLGAVAVGAVVFHGFCVWGVMRVARWRERLRQHRLRVVQACAPPARARAVVDAAMRRSGRGVPQDREAFVLLRNEVIDLAEVDAFTAGVLVWEVTIGAARPGDRHEWLGTPRGEHPATS